MSVFHLYTGTRGEFTAMVQRSVHLAFALGLAFVLFPVTAKWGGPRLQKWLFVPDLMLGALGVLVASYVAFNHGELAQRAGLWEKADLLIAGIGVILVLEATRRSVSPMLAYITMIFLCYAFFGHRLPGIYGHSGLSLEDVLAEQFFTTNGIFGTPLAVSATFVFLFVLFGACLEKGGAGKYLIDVAFASMGRFRGGAAKAAVVASGMMGTISGSSIANTVSTGTMTIPMMKKAGFRNHVAGAVEVAASTNGQLMPPVMGAAAFIMAEMTQIPYSTIVVAALLPALLSYTAIFTMIHLEAVRTGLKTSDTAGMASLWRTLRRGLLLNIPFFAVIFFLLGMPASVADAVEPWVNVSARTPSTSATMAIWVTITLFLMMSLFLPRTTYGLEEMPDSTPLSRKALRFVNKWPRDYDPITRFSHFVSRIWLAFRDAAMNMVGIACACACCGIIIGVASQTSLSPKLTIMVLRLSDAVSLPGFLPDTLPALMLTMVACLVLGMGLPTTATYIIMSILTVPVILQLAAPGVIGDYDTTLILSAHLFVFYYGIMADDTPPVGLCAYAAASIAESDPVRTGLTSFRFDLAAFTLPMIFFYNPALLLQDVDAVHLLHLIPLAIMGMICFAIALQGFAWDRVRWWERLVLLAVSFLLVSPTLTNSLAGLLLLAALVGLHLWLARRAAADSASTA